MLVALSLIFVEDTKLWLQYRGSFNGSSINASLRWYDSDYERSLLFLLGIIKPADASKYHFYKGKVRTGKQNIVRNSFSVFTEAVAHNCSVKKMFLEISQNWQEKTSTRVSFLIKLQASDMQFFKKDFLAEEFSCEFCKISQNNFPYRTPPVAAPIFIIDLEQVFSNSCENFYTN